MTKNFGRASTSCSDAARGGRSKPCLVPELRQSGALAVVNRTSWHGGQRNPGHGDQDGVRCQPGHHRRVGGMAERVPAGFAATTQGTRDQQAPLVNPVPLGLGAPSRSAHTWRRAFVETNSQPSVSVRAQLRLGAAKFGRCSDPAWRQDRRLAVAYQRSRRGRPRDRGHRADRRNHLCCARRARRIPVPTGAGQRQPPGSPDLVGARSPGRHPSRHDPRPLRLGHLLVVRRPLEELPRRGCQRAPVARSDGLRRGVAFALANAIGTVPNALLAFMDSQRRVSRTRR